MMDRPERQILADFVSLHLKLVTDLEKLTERVRRLELQAKRSGQQQSETESLSCT